MLNYSYKTHVLGRYGCVTSSMKNQLESAIESPNFRHFKEIGVKKSNADVRIF